MSAQDVSNLLKGVPIEQCKLIVAIARSIVLTMYDSDLLVSEQLLLPKVLEMSIKDINEIDGIGIIKDSIVLNKRNGILKGSEH